MDLLLDPLEDPSIWSGVPAEPADHDTQYINYHASTALRFSKEQLEVVCAVLIPSGHQGKLLSLTMRSYKFSHQNSYKIGIGTHSFTIIAPSLAAQVTIPILENIEVESFTITSLHGGDDYLLVSDLRIINTENPSDLLNAIKRGIEREIHSTIIMGGVSVKAGDKEIVFSESWDYIERNVVIRLGRHQYQLKNIIQNTASLGYTFDGDTILEDYEGDAIVEIPVEVGYYDEEAELPGVAIWYGGITPTERYAPNQDRYWCTVDDSEILLMRNYPFETWDITIDVAAHSPELVAVGSTAVRRFLAQYVVWYHGIKLWFNWEEQPETIDPFAAYDLVSRVLYKFKIELQEELWQEKTANAIKNTIITMEIN
jgi:hypothetical protein